jgi:subtilisin-like proprotein convertase family protein
MNFKTHRYRISRPIISALALILISVLAGMKYEHSSASTAQATRVDIDVLPGEASKFVDATSRSTIPVAILSSEDFDATTVIPASVRFAGAPITKGKGAQSANGTWTDVNGDGRIDLIVSVSVYSLHLAAGTSEALLTATTVDRKTVTGSQQISFKPMTIQMEEPKPSAPASGSFTNYSECGHAVGVPCPIIINDATQGVPPDPPTPGKAFRYPSSIDVSGQGAVTKVTVTITNYAHTFPDDVDILLVGPTGATCLLMSDCGGDNAITSPVNITYDDAAASGLPDNPPTAPLATGSYKPTRGTPTLGSCASPSGDYCVPANFPSPAPAGPYGTTLAVFNGTNPNGTWKLYVIDDTGGDDGNIFNGWTLNITAPSPCPGSIFPGSQSFDASGGMDSFSVIADAGCNWTAVSNAAWIHTSSSGSGNGTANYTVDANPGATIRNGTITIGFLTFTVYQGINFNDVAANNPFYNDIGKLSARGVTLGCGNGNYCPNDSVTREQMAAFILRAKGEFDPPTPESQRFVDVPPSNTFYAFIDRLAVLGITQGCNPPTNNMYCPASPVTREQMSAFILRGLGEFDPPTPATQRFNDVPPSNVFYNFIDRLAVLNITLGCTPDHMSYCPGDPVTRAQMAAFLVRAFSL